MARNETPSQAVGRYQCDAERVAALEARYSRPPELGCLPDLCCRSILACVESHQNALVTLYMAWCRTNHVQDAGAGSELGAWEEQTLGARLYPAAHGVLLFAVQESIHGPRRIEKQTPRVQPGLTDEQRLTQMEVALHKLTEEKEMPDDRMSGREWDARRRKQLEEVTV